MTINNNPKIGIPAWYAAKSVFVTGATGFMGKILVEKLLRSCPEVDAIYLLIRPKKDLTPLERFKQYIGHLVFDGIRGSNPKLFNKLRVIAGDTSLLGLGLSDEDRRELIEKVNIIFHCAATIRFDYSLKTAILFNSRGTLFMLQLALEMRRLAAFVHVSTTYVSHYEVRLQEKGYPTGFQPLDLIKMAETVDDAFFESIAPKVLGKYKNTYQFTKALAENLLEEFGNRLPIAVARPAIITCAMKEPLLGYVEGLYGPLGLTVTSGQGILNVLLISHDNHANMVPVDYVCNATIAVGWGRGLAGSTVKEVQYFNFCDSLSTPVGNPGMNMIWDIYYKNPYPVYFYPWSIISSSVVLFTLHIGYCLLFGFLLDLLLRLIGQKAFLVKVYKKIYTGMLQYRHFTCKQWIFDNPKCKELFERLSAEDKKIFPFAFEKMDWREYLEIYLLGCRKYLCKFKKDNMDDCRKNLKRLWVLNKVFSVIKLYLLYLILSSYGGSILNFSRWVSFSS